MNKTNTVAVFFFLLCTASAALFGKNKNFDEFLFDDIELNNFTEEYDWTITRDKQDVIDLLEDLGVIELLKESLFLRTHPLNTRNIPDLVFWRNTLTYYPCVSKYKKPNGFRKFGFSLYYNQTTRMVFVCDSTGIASYLAIKTNSFLDRLENVIERLGILIPNLDIDPRLITDLFKNFTVQERRAGAYFSASYAFDVPRQIILCVSTPLCYCERNHFLTEGETARIEEELGSSGRSPEEQREFEDAHFVSDRLGIGDTRITVDTPIHKSSYFQAIGSFFITIPTALTFASGVIRGKAFCPPCPRPLFDLSLLLDDEARANGTLHTQLEQFLLSALDNLNANLLDTRLGNNGHFGAGLGLYFKSPLSLIIPMPWAEKFRLKSRYSAEFLFPATETRFFITCSDLHDFDIRNFNDTNQTNNNFDFLTQTLTNRLYPFALPTRISPSPILRSTSNLTYSNRRFQWDIGTDTWIQPQEGLHTSCNHSCGTFIPHPLNKQIAKKPFAYQGKVFTSLAYNHIGYESIWTFSIFLDKTISSSGIGLDFTLALGIHGTF